MAKRFTDKQLDIIKSVLRSSPSQAEAKRLLESRHGIEISKQALSNVARTGNTTTPKIRGTTGEKRVVLPHTSMDPENPVIRAYLVNLLTSKPSRVRDISVSLSTGEATVNMMLQHLQSFGYCLEWKGDYVSIAKHAEQGASEDIQDHSPIEGGIRRFGLIGDTHLCSAYERLDVLEAAYDRYSELGITQVYHTGNTVDGEFRHNRYELKAHGVTDQAVYFLDHYPQREGITTFYITADDHEGWWMQREGIDFGRYLQHEAENRGREDLQCIGYMEADIEMKTKRGSSILRVFHPGGGSSYALSYSTQKIVESLQGGEKPAVLAVGHYHKAVYHMVRNVHVVQTGCTQDQTRFMRKKKIEAHVGFWTVELEQDARGAVRRCTPTFYNWFDRSYHAATTMK